MHARVQYPLLVVGWLVSSVLDITSWLYPMSTPWRDPTQRDGDRVRPQSARLAPPQEGKGAEGKGTTAGRPQSARGRSANGGDVWAQPKQRKPGLDTGMISNKGYSKQSIAVKKQAPRYGFGSATRDQANKLFVSQEHTILATGGKDSPGPAQYILPASVGGTWR